MMSNNQSRYVEEVKAGLEKAHEQTGEPETLDAAHARLIVFSDLHRGARNRADDFRKSERAYNAALAYYFHLGYTLVALGDVEELWEERVKPVLRSYRRSQALEASFHQAGRYVRIWGNHDDTWDNPATVDRYLAPIYGGDAIRVRESLSFRVVHQGEELGELFLVHGHQGTAGSDRYSRLARIPVRWLWRTWQLMTGRSLNTPATDWSLRHRHNLAMHEWATGKERFVLVAGHTHRPVFESKLHEADLEEALAGKQVELKKKPGDPHLKREVAELLAEVEWVRAQGEQEPGDEIIPEARRPSYFNTGCCCYTDGDVTGLEITDGEMRLVRWPDDGDEPKPQVLDRTLVSHVFARCDGTASAPAPAPADAEVEAEKPVPAGAPA